MTLGLTVMAVAAAAMVAVISRSSVKLGQARYRIFMDGYSHMTELASAIIGRHAKREGARVIDMLPMTRAGIEAAKLPLYQLAFDGITLVTIENGRARHTIKNLSANNAGSANPLNRAAAAGESDIQAMLRNVETCFQDGESIRDTFVRPNEVCLATANRADVFFKAPRDSAGRVFTVIAQEEILHTDNFQGRLQRAVARGLAAFGPANPGPVDVVVAHVHVRGTPVEGGDFDVLSLRDKLPPVPP